MVTRGPEEARFVVHPLAIPVLLAAVWSTVAAIATHSLGVAGGAAVAATALGASLRRGRAGPELLAVTALFASLGTKEQWAEGLPDGPVAVAGVLVRADASPDGTRIVVQQHGWRLRVWVEGPSALLPGDRVHCIARSTPAAGPGMPTSLRTSAGGVHCSQGRPSFARWTAQARNGLARSIRGVVGGEEGELLVTLVLGERAAIPSDLREAHRATGLSHLLAVSGAHAAMLAWAMGLMPGGRRMRPVRNRLALGIALLLLVAYGAIAGAEAPVVRAVCTCVVGAVAANEGRRLAAAGGLSAPAILTAHFSPAELLTPGFVLSYSAVMGLVCAASVRPSGAEGALEQWVRSPLRASVWAMVTTAPWTLLWFGQFAPWTIALTPLLAPLVAVLLLLGLAAAVGGTVAPVAAALPAWVLPPLCAVYSGTVRLADGLPFTPVLASSNPEPFALVAGFAFAAAAVVAYPSARGAAVAAALACAPHFLPTRVPTPGFQLLAVGHGQCAVATLEDGSTVVVDCGSADHPHWPAQQLVARLRRRRVDLLVITHGDRDHVSGIPALLENARVVRAVLPADLSNEPCGRALRDHGAELILLAPGEVCEPHDDLAVAAPSLLPGHENDGSLWVRIQLQGISLLLCGDAEARGIGAALRSGAAAPSTVLVAPHHGRPTPASTRLLDAVRPAAMLVSCGTADGLSAQGVEARARGIQVFPTGLRGHLTVEPGSPPRVRGALPEPLDLSPGRGLQGRGARPRSRTRGRVHGCRRNNRRARAVQG